MNLIAAISRSNVKDLVIASNDGGAADVNGDHAWGL
jgi:acyl CoA:acetate/3-ketoacid CoA transferase alpha subunit